ncbi:MULTISPECIES: flagellar export chaperone FliS [Paenibacillus]|uniref:Flagellar secretion chaperone FliS n=1 Tax=Paenibacillus azoreducens TaxID=116718 RepID=A0A919YFV9_9BACL|nr:MULTISPECIES: flagellar export chaperone FliS [Paenibacillus]MBE9916644.1 flagellar export chaperone FliS [Paenibacillus donghaensis]GIO48908.1 flagellar protein FliS [Paenibacillus azoreducens]
MITSPYEKYRQSSVQTSNPARLLIMLYDGAIRFVRAGIEGINEGDHQKTNDYLKKAQAIITELTVTLDHSFDVSKGLSALYEYMNYLLIEANVRKEAHYAEEALGYLIELRETWVQASKMSGSEGQHASEV